MKNIKLHIVLFSFGIFFGAPFSLVAQIKETDSLAIAKQDVNKDDLGNVSDKFQEYFFAAISQRAIENYEKAIGYLKKCKEIQPNETVVYFELGKNYKAIKDYSKAEENLKKALSEKTNDQSILTELYDVYYLTQNYPSAIKIATDLTNFNLDYYEDLANLYVRTSQYDKALEALDYIDEKQGQSDYREALRRKIFAENDDKKGQLIYLKNKLSSNPENIQNYTNLIFYYSELGNVEAAYKVAQELQKKYPDAVVAQLALYKMYMQQNKPEKAVQSMKLILKSTTIDADIKEKVVKDFTTFVKEHPSYEGDLVETLGEEIQGGKQSNKQLGEFYIGKNNPKAIHYFQLALQETPTDFDLLEKTILLQVQEKKHAEALNLAKNALAFYPSQPIFYLLQGVSYNALQNHKKAEESLKTGLDFLIDNPQMEIDFYQQLEIAENGLGKTNAAQTYKEKAATLKNNNAK